MLNKLDRLPVEDPEQELFPDTSFLSRENQDRVKELFAKMGDPDDLNDPKWTITKTEMKELKAFLDGLPLMGPHDSFAGPSLEIPRGLQSHFTWREQNAKNFRQYTFFQLKAVQKVRFVELCRQYGWTDEDEGFPRHTRNLAALCRWAPEDQAEMHAFLDEAAKPYKWLP
jgi:hypothetical protein